MFVSPWEFWQRRGQFVHCFFSFPLSFNASFFFPLFSRINYSAKITHFLKNLSADIIHCEFVICLDLCKFFFFRKFRKKFELLKVTKKNVLDKDWSQEIFFSKKCSPGYWTIYVKKCSNYLRVFFEKEEEGCWTFFRGHFFACVERQWKLQLGLADTESSRGGGSGWWWHISQTD